jgi:hypothetical protein
MDAERIEAPSGSSSQTRENLGQALQSVQAAALQLRAAQGALKSWVNSFGDFVPQQTTYSHSQELAKAYSTAASGLHEQIASLATTWSVAINAIKESTGLLFECPIFAETPLQRIASGALEPAARKVRDALTACQTWDALKAQAVAEDIALPALPADTTLEGLPEAVAARQIETEQVLERLAAPRLLQNTLAEILAGESPPTTLEGLLSTKDWETILDGTQPDTVNWALYSLALRHCGTVNRERLVREVRQLLERASVTGLQRSKVLSFLSREQFVFAWTQLPGNETELQLALVTALLESERSDYWFWEPLEAFTRADSTPAPSKWHVLLHRLAQSTISGGFETLRAAVKGILENEPRAAADPRQAFQALTSHLHEPISCGDRSRFRLRQFA